MAKTYDPRRAEPGTRISWHDGDGEEVTLRADDKGVVRVRNAADQRAADAFDLPVARAEAAKQREQEEKAEKAEAQTEAPAEQKKAGDEPTGKEQ